MLLQHLSANQQAARDICSGSRLRTTCRQEDQIALIRGLFTVDERQWDVSEAEKAFFVLISASEMQCQENCPQFPGIAFVDVEEASCKRNLMHEQFQISVARDRFGG